MPAASFYCSQCVFIPLVLSYLLVADKGAYQNFQKDLGLSDFQVSIVVGSVYTFTNGFANLFFGVLADKYPRKWLWLSMCVLWSVCTFAESLCTNFIQILFARIGFAMVMGSNIPLSVSLLSDFTMPSERGVAQSIYAAGVYLGVGMSSISVLLDGAVGWRNTIRIICGISWALCIPMFFVPEPIRNETNRLAALEVKKAVANEGNFDNLALRADDTAGPSDDVVDSNKVSISFSSRQASSKL